MLVASGNEGIENGGVGETFIFALWFVDFPLVLRLLGGTDSGASSIGPHFPLM